jgi:hypothetical protein
MRAGEGIRNALAIPAHDATLDTDTAFERTLAGHVETGGSSVSDPAFGTP